MVQTSCFSTENDSFLPRKQLSLSFEWLQFFRKLCGDVSLVHVKKYHKGLRQSHLTSKFMIYGAKMTCRH